MLWFISDLRVQIRAARAALRWTADDLAKAAGVATKTVRRVEAEDVLPNTTIGTLRALEDALATAGIEFVGTPEDGPGIRVRKPPGG